MGRKRNEVQPMVTDTEQVDQSSPKQYQQQQQQHKNTSKNNDEMMSSFQHQNSLIQKPIQDQQDLQQYDDDAVQMLITDDNNNQQNSVNNNTNANVIMYKQYVHHDMNSTQNVLILQQQFQNIQLNKQNTYKEVSLSIEKKNNQNHNHHQNPKIQPLVGINTNLNLSNGFHHSTSTIINSKNEMIQQQQQNHGVTVSQVEDATDRSKENANFQDDEEDDENKIGGVGLPSKKQRLQRDILVQQTMSYSSASNNINNNANYQNDNNVYLGISSRYQSNQTEDFNASTGALQSDRGLLISDYQDKLLNVDYQNNGVINYPYDLEENKSKKKRGSSKQQPRQTHAQVVGHNHQIANSNNISNSQIQTNPYQQQQQPLQQSAQQFDIIEPNNTINMNNNKLQSNNTSSKTKNNNTSNNNNNNQSANNSVLRLNVDNVGNHNKNLSISQQNIDGLEFTQGSVSARMSKSKFNTKRRRDQFGTRIQKGQKRHKVSFIDQIHKQALNEVFIVENFKKLNKKSYDNDDDDDTHCHCCLF